MENGHVNTASLRVIKVLKKIQTGDVPEHVYLLEAKVVASQKGQWYLCRVAISEDFTTLLGRPYQSCECVVRRGPTDSHHLAVFLMTLTVRNVMSRLEDKSWQVLRQHLPPHIVVMQKVPMTVMYAYGPGSQARFKGISTGHMKALLKMEEAPTSATEKTAPAAVPTVCTPTRGRPNRMHTRGRRNRMYTRDRC